MPYTIQMPETHSKSLMWHYVRETRRESIQAYMADGWHWKTWKDAYKSGYRTVKVKLILDN